MPPIELGPTHSPSVRISGAAAIPTPAPSESAPPEPARTPPQPAVVRTPTPASGSAPIDTDRVALIRKAVAAGTYPVVPAKIADAMIAARFLLGSTQ